MPRALVFDHLVSASLYAVLNVLVCCGFDDAFKYDLLLVNALMSNFNNRRLQNFSKISTHCQT